MAASSKKNRNYFRLALQYIIVILLAYMVIRPLIDKSYLADFEAYCPIGGMQAFSSWMVNNTLACSMTTLQIAMGFALIAGVLIFSKLFCGYVCPIGIFTEWLGRLGQKRRLRYTITGMADRMLRILKYGLLFITFYFTIKSSELFCREYDPFYAVFTGFGHDVTAWMAILGIAITIFGSFFIRQFWCKYLCPLGAASNIFAFTIPFVAVTLLYILLLVAGAGIPWYYYLAAVVLLGFLMEAFQMKTIIFPLIKVTRHDKICTSCRICDKACPYALDISTVDKVRHIDCTLCGDCVVKCPEKGALTYNGRLWKWLPAAAVVVLVTGGILFSSFTEIPTIDEKWGTPEQMSNTSVFQMAGIKNVKCFGSSMAFANHIREVPGILGVQTFVKRHGVKVYFDPEVITAEQVKAAIFTPTKSLFRLPGTDVKQLASAELAIDRFFDQNDSYFMNELLGREEGIFSFETEFGEPVKARVIFDKAKIGLDQIKSVIESKELVLGEGKDQITQQLGFKVASATEGTATMSREDFISSLFTPYDKKFNGYEKADTTALLKYVIPFPECVYTDKKPMVNFLRNHMMPDKGLVRFETFLDQGQPMLRLYFIEGKTTPDALYMSLTQQKIHVTYKDGTTEDFDNPFSFPGRGQVVR